MLLFFTARAGREKNGRAAIMIKREEEEEDDDDDKDRDEEECIVDGSEDVVDGLKSVGECKSFPTGAMKLRLVKHFMSELVLVSL